MKIEYELNGCMYTRTVPDAHIRKHYARELAREHAFRNEKLREALAKAQQAFEVAKAKGHVENMLQWKRVHDAAKREWAEWND